MSAIIVTVDVVLLVIKQGQLCVALLARDKDPSLGELALPGGYVHPEEDRNTRDAARRVLFQKTGVIAPYLAQLQSFSGNSRDARGWSVSDAYYALVDEHTLAAGEGGQTLTVLPVAELPVLPFDHNAIIAAAVSRVRNQSTYSSLPCYLLPALFTLTDLMHTYELVIGTTLEKSSFRAKVRKWDFIEPVIGAERIGAHRPAQLFQLTRGAKLEFFDHTMGSLG